VLPHEEKEKADPNSGGRRKKKRCTRKKIKPFSRRKKKQEDHSSGIVMGHQLFADIAKRRREKGVVPLGASHALTKL